MHNEPETSQAIKPLGRIGSADRSPTVSERLTNEKERLETRLEEVKSALEVLNRSPEVRDALDAIGKLGHIY